MNFHPLRALGRCACAAMLALLAAPAFAQYPAKPIRFVVAAAAGGTADLIARAIGTPMSQTLGQPIIIDNKAGGEGLIAADFVAKAAPDGYTILFANSGVFSYAPAARKSLPFDPVADFAPVGQVAEFAYFMFVHPSLPVRDLKEFVSYAKANPGKLNHGAGSTPAILLSSAFAQAHKLDFQQVPYKGDAPLTPDLLSGRVQFAIATGLLLPHVKDGKLRAIATFLPERSPLLPDVQTVAEAGLAAPEMAIWAGILGPAKIPPEIVQRLSRALVAALAQPEVRERIASLAGQVRPSQPQQFGAYMKQQLNVWRREAQAAGIQPE